MKYLVTGASGFLGSHLCESLLSQGNEVIGIDSNVIGRLENIWFAQNSPRFQFIQADLREWYESPRVDGIFHLASPTAPAETYKHPQMTIEVNTDATASLLEVAQFWGARMVFASSIKVSDTLTFASSYIAGKREGERICEQSGLGVKIARMGNVFGPRMAPDDSRVIPTFCRNIRDGKPLSVWGDGRQVDSFCYVSDAIQAIILLMKSPIDGVVEIGNPQGITIEDLAHTVIETLHADTSICYEQPGGAVCVVPVDGTMSHNRTQAALHAKARKVPDITLAAEKLHWTPQVSLPVGIRRTFEYYKSL